MKTKFFKAILSVVLVIIGVSSYSRYDNKESVYEVGKKMHNYSKSGASRIVLYTTFRTIVTPKGGYSIGHCPDGLMFNCFKEMCVYPEYACSCLTD